MRNFFESSHFDWPLLRDSLHVYVLPDERFSATVQPVVGAIAAFDGCAAVAPPWQHATVTRIPWWRGEVDAAAVDRFAAALTAIAADTARFALEMQGPLLHDLGVGVLAAEGPEWKQLHTAVRNAAVEVFGAERPLPPPPPMPHVSLGYGIAERDSGPLERSLSDIRTPAVVTVDALHFLSVHADPEAGTFTWDPISSHPLR
ncbi:hypothetical protein NDR87_15925 [Nocardia sp. CDC159]|uniref:2'-5' RNA ligase n=1 Tax=Nocardia pulmonis TaxID=2951408 RepID=A0A9X2IXI5_9NOCA|nr:MULTISPECIES: 2'-5' RNA ligase family protein [Nocardia]MCM6775418.1 hypothetical protein [Nocardia pulmonis]MCM6787848.1 hypothetical protein [Nocardia sp. CDC159]